MLGDAWPELQDFEALVEENRNEAETANRDDDTTRNDDAGYQNRSNDDESGDREKALEERFRKWQDELAAAIANGDQNNGIYKGLQRQLNARNREIAETRQHLDEARSTIDEMRGLMEELKTASEWNADTLINALPEEERATATARLADKKGESQLARLQKELEQLKKGGSSRQDSGSAESSGSGDEDQYAALLQQAQARVQKFVEGRKKMAKALGFDPDDKRIDYGDDSDAIVERADKFDASLTKLLESQDEDEIDSVRPRGRRVNTRNSGTGSRSSDSGDRLMAGIRQYLGDLGL